MRRLIVFVGLMLGLCWGISAAADEGKTEEKPVSILQKAGLTEHPDLMVRTQMLREIDAAKERWNQEFESLFKDGNPAEYKQARRDYFWKMLGELWERTPLDPQITGTAQFEDGVRIEKTILQTLPRFYATGTMFLPDEKKFAPPYPAVLVVCGHSNNGKASEFYQGVCRLGAENGLAMYIQDPIDQGERIQHVRDGKPYISGTAAHNVVGATSILLGRNTATFEVWDMTRALDYLQSRSDIIPGKLGVAGNSGGGTQSSYLMALDDRVAAAAPSCYICSLFGDLTHNNNPQDAEQNIFGQIGFGMDHIDYAVMRSPKPTLLCTKTGDFFRIIDTWPAYRCAKRIFSKERAFDALSIIEIDGEHGYCPELLEATIRWMVRYLAGRDEMIYCPFVPEKGVKIPEGIEKAEPAPGLLPIIPEKEICSTQNGVMELPEARTTYDINRDFADILTARRAERYADRTAEELSAAVRETAGIPAWDAVPVPKRIDADGEEDFILEPEEGIYLPVRAKNLENADGKTIRLIITQNGRRSEAVNSYFADDSTEPAVCVEVRGWGDTQNSGPAYYQHNWFGTDGVDYYYAYLVGKSYVGMRAGDILSAAKYFTQNGGKIALIADGESSGIAVLHAAAAAPGVFESAAVPEGILTWTEQVKRAPAPVQLTDMIHGVLNYYDIDDLKKAVNVQ